MIELLFLIMAVGGYRLVRWIRGRLDGENLNAVKLLSYVVFNGFFVVPYLDIVKYESFPFVGPCPDFLYDHPLLIPISFIMAVIHTGTLPSKDGFRFSSLFKRKS